MSQQPWNPDEPLDDQVDAEPTAETPAAPPPPPARPESRAGRFFRSLLRIVLGAALLFAIGVAVQYFLVSRPAQQQAAALQADLDQARQRQTQAEAERDQAVTQAEGDRAVLETWQTRAYLYQALSGVHEARLALARGDAGAARNALEMVQSTLTEMSESTTLLTPEQLLPATNRLSLALSEADQDAQTAESDLQVLARQLDELEQSLQAQ